MTEKKKSEIMKKAIEAAIISKTLSMTGWSDKDKKNLETLLDVYERQLKKEKEDENTTDRS